MVPDEVLDGVVALAILAISWSINDAGTEVLSSCMVVLDVAHANANEMGDTSLFRSTLFSKSFGDDHRAIGTDGKLRTV